jgi:light-regulated signal transduction histidine kinase (bacteriophytochrome)
MSATDSDLPDLPVNTLDSDPKDGTESLEKKSRPLEVTRLGYSVRQGEVSGMEMVNIMAKIQLQFTAAKSVQSLLDLVVGVVQDLTRFHRVMVYQFDSSFKGSVVAEIMDPRASQDVYRGLRFPASDIPAQARALYKINKVRLLFDRE